MQRVLTVGFYTAVVILAALIILGLGPYTAEICEQAKDAGQNECTRYSLLFYVLWGVRKISEFSEPFFTIISGLAIAAFTATLWWSTRRLWEAGERQIKLIEANAEQQSADMRASVAAAQNAANAAIEANNLNRDMFVATERPWVTIGHAHIAGPLIFDEWGAEVGLALTLTNFGKTPATNIRLGLFLHPASPTMRHSLTAQQILWQDMELSGPSNRRVASVLYPELPHLLHRPAATNRTQLFKATSGETKTVVPLIIGCIIYSFASGQKRFYTRFMYNLERRFDGLPMPIDPANGNVPTNQLGLLPSQEGWDAS